MDIAREVPPNTKLRVILVEGDRAVRRSLQLLLQANGYDVRAYANGATLIAEGTLLHAACLIADYGMPDCDGIDTLMKLRTRGWIAPAILITGSPSLAVTSAAANAGFNSVLEKPLRQHVLVRTLERLVPAGDGAQMPS